MPPHGNCVSIAEIRVVVAAMQRSLVFLLIVNQKNVLKLERNKKFG